MQLGINTYGLSRLLKDPFIQSIQTLKQNGITAMEPCIRFKSKAFSMDTMIEIWLKLTKRDGGVWRAGEAKMKIAKLRAEGVRIDGAHIFCRTITEETIEQALAFAKENGLHYYAVSYITDSLSKAQRHIPMLSSAVKKLSANGIHLLLHNHDTDLKETDGRCVLDFLLDSVPELELELDLGWAAYSGLDCVTAMDKYRERLRILHFKDMRSDHTAKQPRFCAVGEGIVPLDAIMNKAQSLELFPVGMVIDQDESEGDMLADVLAGASHIREANG